MTFLIMCPLLFLAGMVDAIGGGGGLISLPAYLIAGVPAHAAIATNKLSSCCGTSLATWRFIRAGLVNFRLAVPAVIAAIIGSSIGANLSLMVPEKIMIYILTGILPIAVFLVLNKKLFNDSGTDKITLDKRTYLTHPFPLSSSGCMMVFTDREPEPSLLLLSQCLQSSALRLPTHRLKSLI